MYKYKRILVALHCHEEDAAAVRYAGLISHMAETEAVYLVPVVGSSNIPPSLLTKYPEVAGTMNQFARNHIDKMTETCFMGRPETRVIQEVLEGSEITEYLRLIRREDIDLVLTSRKSAPWERSLLAEKLARKAPCSIFIIPAGFMPAMKKILVPVDFSKYSRDALDVAIGLARASGISEITCLHVYSLPIPAFTLGVRFDEMAASFKEWSQERYEQFIADLDLSGINVTPVFELDADVAGTIVRDAKTREVDLLVMGTRGRGAIGVLLGSVTEQVIWNVDVPLLAVKEKGSGRGLLEYLFKTYYEYHR